MKRNPWNALIKPSTQRLFLEGRRISNYSLFDFLHGYVYTRWPYLYIGIGTGEHPLAKRYGPAIGKLVGFFDRWLLKEPPSNHTIGGSNGNSNQVTFADTYHGKVVPLEPAIKLVTIGEDIELPDLEHVIPYKLARDIVLKNPDHIAALECPCRTARENPCLPLDVCLIVGEPFASFVIDHNPERARWISQGEAVDILRAEDERGHVHHAFFKDAMLGRFYAICNCCACCCGAMQAHQNGTPMLASSGYIAQIDEGLCIGCEDCQELCQFGALTASNGRSQVDTVLCMGCGVCVDHCDQQAISLKLEPDKGVPLEICDLIATTTSGQIH